MKQCPNCNAEVDDSYLFCPLCGHKFQADNPDESSEDEQEKPEETDSEELLGSTAATAPLSPLQQVKIRTAEDQDFSNLNKFDTNKKLLLALLAVGLLVSIGIIMSFQNRTGFKDPQATQLAERAKNKEKSESEKTPEELKAEQEEQDKQVKADLDAIYAKVESLPSELSTAFDDFNSYYLKRRVEREPIADKFNELKEKIDQVKAEVEGLHIPDSSAYKEQYQALKDLVDQLAERAKALKDAWDLDLSFNYPGYYIDKIMEPVNNYLKSQGDEQSVQDKFNELLEKAKI